MEGRRVMPEVPLDVTALLGPERAAFVDLLDALAPAQWDLPTECPAWTVKGVALHVLGDDLSLLSRQRDASTDKPDDLCRRPSGRDLPRTAGRIQRAVGRRGSVLEQ